MAAGHAVSVPRVVQYIRLDGRFANTSVWVVDDVMGVINYLAVPGEAPQYEVK